MYLHVVGWKEKHNTGGEGLVTTVETVEVGFEVEPWRQWPCHFRGNQDNIEKENKADMN